MNHAFDLRTYEECMQATKLRKAGQLTRRPESPKAKLKVADRKPVSPWKYTTVREWLQATGQEPAPEPVRVDPSMFAVEPEPAPVPDAPPSGREWLHVSSDHKRIIREVSERHGYTYEDVVSSRREAALCEARFEAICAVHVAYPLRSLPQLGKYFNRDHTTILHTLQEHGPRFGVTRFAEAKARRDAERAS